jgi:hypothetical protein
MYSEIWSTPLAIVFYAGRRTRRCATGVRRHCGATGGRWETMIAIPPSIRRLMSHWCLFPNRIDRAGVGHIAKSVMLEKSTLSTCFDFCDEDPYAFMLIWVVASMCWATDNTRADFRF